MKLQIIEESVGKKPRNKHKILSLEAEDGKC